MFEKSLRLRILILTAAPWAGELTIGPAPVFAQTIPVGGLFSGPSGTLESGAVILLLFCVLAAVVWRSVLLWRRAGDLTYSLKTKETADEALKITEADYRSLVDLTPDIIYRLREDGTIAFVSAAVRKLGYAPEELIGRPFTDLIHPEDLVKAETHFVERRTGERGMRNLEIRLVGKERGALDYSCRTTWVELSARGMWDVADEEIQRSDKRFRFSQGIARDVTESRRAEEALRLSREHDGRQARETEVLVEIGRLIGSTLDIEEVYEPFAVEVRKLIPFDRLGVSQCHLHDDAVKIAYVTGMEVPGRSLGDLFPLSGTFSEAIMRTRKGFLLHPQSEAEFVRRFPSLSGNYQAGVRSFLSVPLIARDTVIGVLNFRARTPNVYTEGDLRLAQRIADQIAGAIASARLFADLKKTERSLRESEARFRPLFEQAAVGVAEKDTETGRYLTVNRRHCEIFGMTEAEMLATTSWAVTHSEDRDLHREKMALLKDGKIGSFSLEKRYIRKDGKVIWANILVSPLWKPGEVPLRNITVVEDITERKQMAEELRHSEKRYRSIFQDAIEGIFLSTPEGRYISVNPAMAKICGYGSPEEMIATIQDMATQHYAVPQNRTLFREILAEYGRVENFEYQAQRKDGRRIWLSANAHVVRDEQGKVLYYEGTNQDITWRKEAEEERLRLEERLRRAEKMEAVGTLAGGVAHDLNNVLGALVGYSELLLNAMPEGSPQRRYVENILQSGLRGAAIIQDLLTLARRGVAISEVVSLNGLVSDYFLTPELENLKAHHPQVRFVMELDEDLLNIQGSPVHLSKTIMNLISNAAESITGPGEVLVRTGNRYMDQPVRGYDEIQEGDYAVLTVSDNGMGIPRQDMGKIFEPFYTKKVMGRSGTGLGLAVVWGTMKDHRGYIDVRSEPGKGSTFTLFFPVTREELVEGRTAIAPESYGGRGETVLVVDDVPEQRELALCMLARLGYRAAAVSGGEEALQYLSQNEADLLILDMIMDPGMDGLETYRRIIALRPGQKAIIVSGFSETDRVKKAQELGAGAYIRKPYILERIGLAIRGELDRR